MEDATRRFTAIDNRNETREILSSVYDSLKVKGYNPITSSSATSSRRTHVHHELQQRAEPHLPSRP